jgi:CubicO group peptidase (beta-lactamase class C family)
MTNSASGPHAEVLEGAARGHAFNDGDPVVIDEPWYHNYQGAAGVFLSALDTATWMRLQLGHFPEVVNATTLRELHLPHTFLRGFDRRGVSPAPACLDEPYPCTYALGWSRSGFHDAPMISHGGGQFGWRAYIALLPTKDAGVAVFANSDRAMVREISLTVLDVVMGEEPGDWYEKAVALREMLTPQVMEGYFPEFFRPVKDAPPSLAISDYAGTYRHPGLGDVIVGVTDGGLAYRQVDGRIWDGILTHLGGNVFELEFEHVAVRAYLPMRARFRFEVDDGRAVAIQNTEKTTYVRVPES